MRSKESFPGFRHQPATTFHRKEPSSGPIGDRSFRWKVVLGSQIDAFERELPRLSPPTSNHFPSERTVADWPGRRFGEGVLWGLRDKGRTAQNTSARKEIIKTGRSLAALICESFLIIDFSSGNLMGP